MKFRPELPSLLLLAFREADMVIQDTGCGFTVVRCPWCPPKEKGRAAAAFLTLANSLPNLGKFTCVTCRHVPANEVLEVLPRPAVLRACMRLGVRLDEVLAAARRTPGETS